MFLGYSELLNALDSGSTTKMSVREALGGESLGSRRSVLERTKKRFGELVAAGRRDLEFYVSVRMRDGWDVERE